MADINKLFGQLLNSGVATGLAGGLAGGIATGLLSKKTRKKIGKTALTAGGVAAVGALAYTAYKKYNNHQQTTSNAGANSSSESTTTLQDFEVLAAPQNSAFLPALENQQENDDLALTLIRAMIAASRADGVMDSKESQTIFGKIEELGLDSENQTLLIQEMNQSIDMDALVKSATSPEIAAEIYTASLLAIDVDNAAERGYLAMLAARLQIPQPLVQEIEQLVANQQAV